MTKPETIMNDKSFATTITVDESPEVVFAAEITGESEKVSDQFTYRHKDVHYSKQRVTESVPGKRVVWLVVESQLNFVEEKSEWNDTEITFEIAKKGAQTELRFTHVGLVPAFECFGGCSGAWGSIITRDLRRLITQGA